MEEGLAMGMRQAARGVLAAVAWSGVSWMLYTAPGTFIVRWSVSGEMSSQPSSREQVAINPTSAVVCFGWEAAGGRWHRAGRQKGSWQKAARRAANECVGAQP